MKHPTKKEEKRVQSFLKSIEWMFHLQNYDRSIVFSSESKDDFAASVELQNDYQRIEICIYPLFWRHSLKQQRVFLLHEFIHTLSEPLKTVTDNLFAGKLETREHIRVASEKTVSSITNLFDRFLRNHDLDYAKKAYEDYLK